MKEFTAEELSEFYDTCRMYVDSGDEKTAMEYIGHHMQRFPDEVRKELLARMFFEEIANEAEEISEITTAQKEATEALQALETLKAAMEKGKSA